MSVYRSALQVESKLAAMKDELVQVQEQERSMAEQAVQAVVSCCLLIAN